MTTRELFHEPRPVLFGVPRYTAREQKTLKLLSRWHEAAWARQDVLGAARIGHLIVEYEGRRIAAIDKENSR